MDRRSLTLWEAVDIHEKNAKNEMALEAHNGAKKKAKAEREWNRKTLLWNASFKNRRDKVSVVIYHRYKKYRMERPGLFRKIRDTKRHFAYR